MTRTIRILGCGSSGGVPRVGQGWGACDPTDPRNRRRRCSILFEQRADGRDVEGEDTKGPDAVTRVLVDTSPDLREQLLAAGVDRLDAILVTHPHADHINGIDDVRPLVIRAKNRIAMHMDDATAAVVRRGFDYIFETPPGSHYPPLMDHRRVVPGSPTVLDGPGGRVEVEPFRLNHGDIDALGYRFGAAAYTPDVKTIPDESLDRLRDLDVWIIDALRYTSHPSHFALADALAWIDRLKPRRAVLTNLHTDMDFATLAAQLPPHIEPAFDGMIISA